MILKFNYNGSLRQVQIPSGDQVLKVTITNTGSSFTSDRTYSEIVQSIENGGTVYLEVQSGDYFEVYNLSDGEEYNNENILSFSRYDPIWGQVGNSFTGLTRKWFQVSLDNEDTVWTYGSNDLYIPSASGGGNNPTIDTEWEDVYGEWQAGYYYDPDNDYAYTQIPSTETTWGETETYISVSCTPYTNLIPVNSGEEWRYLNLPIYFDSKQAIVPSIILFDSSKNVVETYTRSYEDVYTQFIIPSDATQMAVLYANNQEYVLQKRVAKTLDKDALLVDIMADYRSYSLITPPTPKTLTKGYICLGTDDLRSQETKNLHNVFTTNNIPYYMAAIPGALKNCIPDDPYKTNLDYMRLCVTNGGEIICHSAPVITANNKNDFDTMYTYFCKNKQELEAYGFKVRGIFKAGGENAIYDAPDPIIDAWATHYYEFGDYFTESFPFYNPRTILEDWEDYSGFLDNLVEEICVNHGYFIGTFHLYNSSTQLVITTLLNKLSNYTRGVDYDFVTPGQLYDLLMPSGPSSGSASDTTYGLSMSNNIITLTGSDGSTSTVTLPVYGGGVS